MCLKCECHCDHAFVCKRCACPDSYIANLITSWMTIMQLARPILGLRRQKQVKISFKWRGALCTKQLTGTSYCNCIWSTNLWLFIRRGFLNPLMRWSGSGKIANSAFVDGVDSLLKTPRNVWRFRSPSPVGFPAAFEIKTSEINVSM